MKVNQDARVKRESTTAPANGAALGLSMLSVAVVQMVSGSDLDANLDVAARLIAEAAGNGAQFVTLPEYFCLMPEDPGDRRILAEVSGAGPLQRFLAAQSLRHGVWLLGGTVPIRCEDPDRVRNASLLFGPDGVCLARYDKIHLFALLRREDVFDESVVLEPGNRIVSADVAGFRTGLSICYDVRFPELYRALGTPDAPVDLVCVPSAFTFGTGSRHWEVLLRARAIENQCYVVASAQGGVHPGGHRTWGHSMIVDPWGEILACVEDREGIAYADVSRERLTDVRAQLPALRHRRVGAGAAIFGDANTAPI
jgi:deaminated glutathione amidase